MKPHTKTPSTYLGLFKIVGLLAVVLWASSIAHAQLRIVGAISGTVQDQTGAVIANASVTLKDEKTGISKQTTSTERGTFLFPDLASGLYEITVAAPSFQNSRTTNVAVSTSQTTDVRINMQVGATTETITVSGSDAQTLETSSQLVASTLTTQTVAQLPVGNRSNVLALARLAPSRSIASHRRQHAIQQPRRRCGQRHRGWHQ